MSSPLHQFEVNSLISMPKFFGMNFDITNSSLVMICIAIFCPLFLHIISRKRLEIPDKSQAFAESLYCFLKDLVKNNTESTSSKVFSAITSLIMYLSFCNAVGLLPFCFTVTSHVSVTFAMSCSVLLLITIAGLKKNGSGFFRTFLPAGIPLILAPLMIVIEVFTYLMRTASLSIRLSANMVAGHTMLKAVAAFIPATGPYFSFLPLGMMFSLNLLELFIAFLQAYIFAVLTCIYLKGALNIHH